MILIKVFFLILIAICYFSKIMYIHEFSIILLVISVALPVLFFFATIILKFSLKINLTLDNSTVQKNDPFDVHLHITNKSFIPVAKAQALVEFYNEVNGEIDQLELFFPIKNNDYEQISFQLSSKFSGNLKIKIVYIKVFDPLKIYQAKVGKNIATEVIVLPQIHNINGIVNASYFNDEESSIYSQYKSGDDPSEIFDFHNYRLGDNLSRIHWKLSSKKDEFIVKELGLPINNSITVFLNTFFDKNTDYTLPVIDTLLDSTISICNFILNSDNNVNLITFDFQKKIYKQIYITSIEMLLSEISSLIQHLKPLDNNADIQEYIDNFGDIKSSSFSYISASVDENPLSCIDKNIQANFKNIIHIHLSDDDILTDFSNFNIINIPVGKISNAVNEIQI